jgi:uncharacterized protein (TIGR00369 family)
VSKLLELVTRARQDGSWADVIDAIPYARFLGISLDRTADGELVAKLRYGDHLVGNSSLPALHGGTIGALLESAAIFRVINEAPSLVVPKTVTVTVDFLRSAKARDTFANAVVTRQGRRVVNVRAEAWQEARDRPVAVATVHLLLPEGAGEGG